MSRNQEKFLPFFALICNFLPKSGFNLVWSSEEHFDNVHLKLAQN